MTRTMLGAGALTALGTMPVFLLGALAVYVRAELGMNAVEFGIAVSVFWASAALTSLTAGGLIDAMGKRASTMAAGVLTATGGFGTATLGRSWPVLLVLLLVFGMSNAAAQLASNLVLARSVPARHRGLGFGIKQAAVPLSTVIAGIAVPLVGATAGWRWAYVMLGCLGLAVLATGLRMSGPTSRRASPTTGAVRPPLGGLLVVMCAMVCASACVNSFGGFIALWGHHVGLSPSEAGVLIAVGSAFNVVIRVLAGHLADRRQGRNLPWVAGHMGVGAAAVLLASVPSTWAVVPGALVAFALGWSWPGLLIHAVVRIARDSPAYASGLIQAGSFAGGAVGPVLFGLAVETTGYQTAWRITAGVFALAAVLICVARSLFVAALVTSPVVEAAPAPRACVNGEM